MSLTILKKHLTLFLEHWYLKPSKTTFGEVWAQSNDELSEEVAKETYLFALGGICLWSQKMLATFFQREIKTKLSTALSDFLEEADYFAVSRLGFVLQDPKTLDRTSKYMRERRNRTKAVKMIGCPIGKRLSEKRYSCTIQTQPGKSIRFFHTLDSSGVK